MKALEIVWTKGNGKKRKLGTMSHQHLSNIYWFLKVFHDGNPMAKRTMNMVKDVIDYRFETGIKPWKPLPIPGEIKLLKSHKYCNVYSDGTIVLYGKPIGSINHIPNWENI
jgi:hypothetical protein